MSESVIDLMFPDNGKLIKGQDFESNGLLTSRIVDAELDPVYLEFYGDDCVKINSDKYKYITLTRDNLEKMIDLLDDAEDVIDDLNE